jgi:hypothetical protein
MRYLKLYEDFNGSKSDIISDIASLDYILSDEGIEAEYIAEERGDAYLIAKGREMQDWSHPERARNIKSVKIYFEYPVFREGEFKDAKNMREVAEEYFQKLKDHIEPHAEAYMQKPTTAGKIDRSGSYGLVERRVIEVVIEAGESDDEWMGESVDDETAMKHYGIYPEDVKEIFYDLQDPDLFPERLEISVFFKSMLGQMGNLMMDDPMSPKKLQFQHFPFIEVRVKQAAQPKQYGFTQADRNRTQNILSALKEDERFKQAMEIASARLEDEGWKIHQISKDFINDYLEIKLRKTERGMPLEGGL